MADWEADSVADWVADWEADWEVDWVADWVAGWVAGWLGDCFRQSVSDSRKDGSSVLEDEEDMVLMRLTEGVLQEG